MDVKKIMDKTFFSVQYRFNLLKDSNALNKTSKRRLLEMRET